MAFITAEKVKHKFLRRDEEGNVTGEILALNGIDLNVEAGQFVAILGANGSGKSTFAKHLNALLAPSEGTLIVDAKNVLDEAATWDIRQSAGMIFQNPDNQIVAGVVEEDVAFGPENLGIPTDEICKRVDESLDAVGMTDYRKHSPNRLSGGQKQRVAIAGVVAMRPKCILMDESTAMLDPSGRKEVLQTVRRLNKEEGVTVILITHYMEEAVDADVVFVLSKGQVVMGGTPREIFAKVDELTNYGLDVPQVTRLAYELRKEGMDLPEGVLTQQELADAVFSKWEQRVEKPKSPADRKVSPSVGRLAEKKESSTVGDLAEKKESSTVGDLAEKKESPTSVDLAEKKESPTSVDLAEKEETPTVVNPAKEERKPLLCLEQVSYTYGVGTAYARQALKQIDFTVHAGEFIGFIGHTGSGKSTLIQLLNGLLAPTEGRVLYEGNDIAQPGFSKRMLRGKVGLVFQYAEYQLFETTVLKDVAFGPKNQGCSEEEATQRAKEALRQVQLEEACWEMSPFELSGGQKRRAAIAGVIAMEPEVLVLDEPTAGLDPRGRRELFSLIRRLHEQRRMSILLVSHSMEDVAEYVERIVVLQDGAILLDGTPKEVFAYGKKLEEASLAVPQVTYVMVDLKERGMPIHALATTWQEAKEELKELC